MYNYYFFQGSIPLLFCPHASLPVQPTDEIQGKNPYKQTLPHLPPSPKKTSNPNQNKSAYTLLLLRINMLYRNR